MTFELHCIFVHSDTLWIKPCKLFGPFVTTLTGKQFNLGSKGIVRQFLFAGVALHCKARHSVLQSHKNVSILSSLSGPSRYSQRAPLLS